MGFLKALPQALAWIQWGSDNRWFGLVCPAHCSGSLLLNCLLLVTGFGLGALVSLLCFRSFLLVSEPVPAPTWAPASAPPDAKRPPRPHLIRAWPVRRPTCPPQSLRSSWPSRGFAWPPLARRLLGLLRRPAPSGNWLLTASATARPSPSSSYPSPTLHSSLDLKLRPAFLSALSTSLTFVPGLLLVLRALSTVLSGLGVQGAGLQKSYRAAGPPLCHRPRCRSSQWCTSSSIAPAWKARPALLRSPLFAGRLVRWVTVTLSAIPLGPWQAAECIATPLGWHSPTCEHNAAQCIAFRARCPWNTLPAPPGLVLYPFAAAWRLHGVRAFSVACLDFRGRSVGRAFGYAGPLPLEASAGNRRGRSGGGGPDGAHLPGPFTGCGGVDVSKDGALRPGDGDTINQLSEQVAP